MSAGGPLMAIIFIIILPLVWSLPTALVTAELSSAFPSNAGYMIWVQAAFGNFAAFQVGMCGDGSTKFLIMQRIQSWLINVE